MGTKVLTALLLSLTTFLTACGPSADSNTSATDSEPIDILERLQAGGSIDWVEDRFASVTGTTVEHIYFGDGCSIWQFPSYEEVEAADKAGQFGFYQGEVWYGGDDKSGKGVALLTKSKTTDCAQYVFKILNWSSNESKPEENLSSLAGKWGSYSWMQDRVGAFLIIKSLGGNQYFGTFYTQGQSGGVYKDSTIEISDSGDGLAEITWPSGTITTATWGKRDANTPSDIDASWIGDIWFDCLGELEFAQSRADCNFYLVRD